MMVKFVDPLLIHKNVVPCFGPFCSVLLSSQPPIFPYTPTYYVWVCGISVVLASIGWTAVKLFSKGFHLFQELGGLDKFQLSTQILVKEGKIHPY